MRDTGRSMERLIWRVRWGPFRGVGKLRPMAVRAWCLQAGKDRDGALKVVCRAEWVFQFLGKKEAGEGHSRMIRG